MLRKSNEYQKNTSQRAIQESDSEHPNLEIFSLEDFTPSYPKDTGTRAGCMGTLTYNGEMQMLKVEDFAYPISCTNDMNESVALESLSSHLIRTIFGSNYASEINLIETNGTPVKPAQIEFSYVPSLKQQTTTHKVCIKSKYAILSRWVDNTECLNDFEFGRKKPPTERDMEFAINITQIQTIAKLMNMDDYKPANIVRRQDGSLFLVDCAANFCGYHWADTLLDSKFMIQDLKHYFIRKAALKIIRQFAAYDTNKIKGVLDQFSEILSAETRETLLNNIIKTQSQCDKFLLGLKHEKKANSFFCTQNEAKSSADQPSFENCNTKYDSTASTFTFY